MIVFAGPSIVGLDIPGTIDLRPPAMQGDLYLAALERPDAIGLIDGYFEGVPAVWHKEILWAMAEGIPVLGASSMGALRAAELDYFGMVGIGAIYAAYRDGLYEDDDEVALYHAPAEVGYAPLSIAMANIRATMDAAVSGGVLDKDDAAEVVAAAKAMFYGTRVWEAALSVLPPDKRTALSDWLPTGEVDQKQRDAAALIERLATSPPAPPLVSFRFETTRLWRAATAQWESANREAPLGGDGFRLLGDDLSDYSR